MTGSAGHTTIRARLTGAGDYDFFKFEAERGDVLQIYTSDLETSVDTVVEVFAPTNGFQLYGDYACYPRAAPSDPIACPDPDLILLKDDDGGTFANRDSRIQFVAPLDGTYFIRVRGPAAATEPGKASTAAGNYSLSVLRRSEDYSVYYPRFPGS